MLINRFQGNQHIADPDDPNVFVIVYLTNSRVGGRIGMDANRARGFDARLPPAPLPPSLNSYVILEDWPDSCRSSMM